MKSPKEIEKLAETILAKIWKRSCLYPMVNSDKISIIECKEAITDCVIQCQEDNADKKYTEQDLRKAFSQGLDTYLLDNYKASPILENRKTLSEDERFDKFLNSLNKKI